jgi:hypothetical protein
MPDYKGVPDNKEANKATKKATGRPPTNKYSDISLVHIQQAYTEAYKTLTTN